MEPDAQAVVAGLRTIFPDHDWRADQVRFGAFHDVALSDAHVARVAKGAKPEQRVAREARTLWALHRVDLGLPHPRLCSDVFGWQGRVGVLTTRVAGDQRHDGDWTILRDGLLGLLERFAGVVTDDLGLPPARAWCGGASFGAVVAAKLTSVLPPEHAATAMRVVADLETLPTPQPRFVHGDFGMHNLLWHDDRPVAIIDLDHACVADPAIDVAPLVGAFGAETLVADVDEALLVRAMTHRATLSLQVAAAVELAALTSLRDHALQSFTTRAAAGTLHSPDGALP